jgi:hypothetical protein
MVPFSFRQPPVKVAGDENTIMAIVAPHRGEAQSEALANGDWRRRKAPDT